MVLLATTLALAAFMTACGDNNADEAAVDSAAGTESVLGTEQAESEEILPEGMYRSELTNELIDESLKNQRPIAVMVDNESIALPHYGLTQADVVYEMMNSTLNGKITRFMVLVKDWEKIEQLGSIRSVRPTNVLIASEWNAVICHDGGPFYVDAYMADPSVDNFSGTFSRVDNGKPTEYTEYILPGDLDAEIKTAVGRAVTPRNPDDFFNQQGIIILSGQRITERQHVGKRVVAEVRQKILLLLQGEDNRYLLKKLKVS